MSLPACHASDLFTLTSRTLTEDGYLLAPAKIARAGNVQAYKARELGLDSQGIPGDQIVRLLRPQDEVFSPATMERYAANPITLNHPPDNKVNADNWRQRAVGDVREVSRDGDHVGATVLIRDRAAVKAVQSGKAQLSVGYGFDCDLTPGTTADGQEYDGVQRNIRGNHVAIVDSARGGPACRIADTDTEDRPMATRTIVVDGISLELESIQAALVEKLVGEAQKAAKTAGDTAALAVKRADAADEGLTQAKAANDKLETDHAAAIAELTAKIPTAAQIETLSVERAKVVADAAKLRPAFKAEGKSTAAIRGEVLVEVMGSDEALKPVAVAVLGSDDIAKASEAAVKAAFDAVTAAHGIKPAATGSAQDAATARALTGAGNGNGTSSQKLTGRALFLYRENHGGKDPDKATA